MQRSLKEYMWDACRLTLAIKDGKFPTNYKTNPHYSLGKFVDNLYEYSGNSEFLNAAISSQGSLTNVVNANNIHAGYVGVMETDHKNLVIAFRGTEGAMDWVNDFIAYQTSFAPHGQGNVHVGFYLGLQTIATQLIKTMHRLLAEHDIKTIYITGHSKGGALATLMSIMVQNSLIEHRIGEKYPIHVITFGAPRVGDATFKAHYTMKHDRYEAFLDFVPHLPFSEKEKELLPRLGIVSSILNTVLEKTVNFPHYCSVGVRTCIHKTHEQYGHLPPESHNESGEALNSFYAVEPILRKGNFGLLFDTIHNGHYSS